MVSLMYFLLSSHFQFSTDLYLRSWMEPMYFLVMPGLLPGSVQLMVLEHCGQVVG